jgi:hypothetical protein
MKKSAQFQGMTGFCAFCGKLRQLRMSHAIPRAAFVTMLANGGNAIGIPNGDGNAHLTSDTGDAPLLCEECEGEFNRKFDGPLTNALKALENEICNDGVRASVDFEANQLAHAIVSVAWRICRSSAHMYSEVALSNDHLRELTELLRRPTDSILNHCTVRLGRLTDPTPEASGGFDQTSMGQLVKTPQPYLLRTKRTGKFDRFALDWTMFGFLIHLIVPRFLYPRSKRFGGLKRGESRISAVPINIFEYAPLDDALMAGYAAHAEGRLSPALKKRDAKRSVAKP